jgi:hypothetical protein
MHFFHPLSLLLDESIVLEDKGQWDYTYKIYRYILVFTQYLSSMKAMVDYSTKNYRKGKNFIIMI